MPNQKISITRNVVATEVELKPSPKGSNPLAVLCNAAGEVLDSDDSLVFEFEGIKVNITSTPAEPDRSLESFTEAELNTEIARRYDEARAEEY